MEVCESKKGLVIYFEGIDASGKGTQLKLAESYIKSKGYDVVTMRQPGGTYGGKLIRELLLDSDVAFNDLSMAYLFAADRSELNLEMVKHLEVGKIVLCDRSMLSSYVYQNHGCSLMTLERINKDAMKIVSDYPETTILYDIPGVSAFKRLELRNKYSDQKKDNIEKKLNADSFEKLNKDYGHYLNYVPRGQKVNADLKEEDVFNQTKQILDLAILEYDNN